MEGYVQNVSKGIEFAFQRHLWPGEMVSLDDAYHLVGYKRGLTFTHEFISWLESNLDKRKWKIVVTSKSEAKPKKQVEKKVEEPVKQEESSVTAAEPVPVEAVEEAGPAELESKGKDLNAIVQMSFRKASKAIKELESDDLKVLYEIAKNTENKKTLASKVKTILSSQGVEV